MANPEHVEKLLQGPRAWNSWVGKNRFGGPDPSGPYLRAPDLSGADLSGADLTKADLNWANLSEANLNEANLLGAHLAEANLSRAKLGEANLSRSNLSRANLNQTNLSRANLGETDLSWVNLNEADLSWANLSEAKLNEANLRGANLSRANLSEASLRGADFSGADLSGVYLYETVFGDTHLKNAKGLGSCNHHGPSILDHRTLATSPDLPIAFLRGCGLPDAFIDYLPSLFNHALEFYSCFISYSTKDQEFADRLHSDLQSRGIRCWFAPHDMQGGEYSAVQIDRAIQVHDRLLVILSENSMGSSWVVREIKKARKRERAESRRVLFPIGLSEFDAIRKWECLDSDTGEDLAEELRKFHIPDFSKWKSHDSYKGAFERLVKDLAAEQKTTPSDAD